MPDTINIVTRRPFTIPDNDDALTLKSLGVIMHQMEGLEFAVVPQQNFRTSFNKMRACLDNYNRKNKNSFITIVTEGLGLYNLVKY